MDHSARQRLQQDRAHSTNCEVCLQRHRVPVSAHQLAARVQGQLRGTAEGVIQPGNGCGLR